MQWCEDDWWSQNLSQLRDRVKQIDFQVLELIAERMSICKIIGEIKSANGLPIHDPIQEERVMATRIEKGKALGLDEEFVRELLVLLMHYSKKIQTNGAVA